MSTLTLHRHPCHPNEAVCVAVDDEPLASVYLDRDPGKGTPEPEWCLSFYLPGSRRLSGISDVFSEVPGDGPAELAVPAVLEAALDWDFSGSAPRRGARLKQAIQTTDLRALQIEDSLPGLH